MPVAVMVLLIGVSVRGSLAALQLLALDACAGEDSKGAEQTNLGAALWQSYHPMLSGARKLDGE